MNQHGIVTRHTLGNNATKRAYKFFRSTSHGLLLPFARKKAGVVQVGTELTAPDVLAPDTTRANYPRGWYAYATLEAAQQEARKYAATGSEVEIREVRLRGLEVEGFEDGLPVMTAHYMTVLERTT